MFNTPLISIIIPIYKVEDYLRECIDSVLAQTYNNLEIILVDDGSPDRCGILCDEYAKKDNRIVVIHKLNGGLSDARNVGLDICKGDYIAFVDSDDIISEKFIELLYQNIGDSDMAFCGFFYFNDGEIITNSLEKIDLPQVEYFDGKYLLGRISTFSQKGPLVIVAWNKLYKKDIWKNLRYPIGRIHEDEFIIHEILDRCKKVSFIDIPLYFYRQRDTSIMGKFTIKSYLDSVDAFKERELFFMNKKMFNEANEAYNLRYYLFLNKGIKNSNNYFKELSFFKIVKDPKLKNKLKIQLILKKINYNLFTHIKESINTQKIKQH